MVYVHVEDEVDDLRDLADLLILLRRRARMSQRALSRASGISYTQIGDMERGQGGQPAPQTLRSLARGLATDALDLTDVDQTKADADYAQLMQAAGYLRGLGASTRDGADEAAVMRFLTSRSGDPQIAEQLVKLARRYPELSPETQIVVRHLLGTWVQES